MASQNLSRFLLFFALTIPCLSASDYVCHWSPMYSGETQALEIRCATEAGLGVKLYAVVEGEAGGHALKIASGVPGAHALLPAPIEDLDSYRVRRITIRIGKSEYVVVKPEQNFALDSPTAAD